MPGMAARAEWSLVVRATLLRREKMLLADGRIDYVPVISGNTLRGWLRRVGEDLLREQLRYDGQLSDRGARPARRGSVDQDQRRGPRWAATGNSAIPGAAGRSVRLRGRRLGDQRVSAGRQGRAAGLRGRPRRAGEPAEPLRPFAFRPAAGEAFARQDDTDTHVFAGRHQVPHDHTPVNQTWDDGGRQNSTSPADPQTDPAPANDPKINTPTPRPTQLFKVPW